MDMRLTPLEKLPPESEFLMEQLNRLSYSEKKRQLEGAPNECPPFLYRYLSPLKSEFLTNYLVNSFLFLRSPLDFNDPFDMGVDISLGRNILKLNAKYKSLVKLHAPQATRNERRKQVSDFKRDPAGRLLITRSAFEKNIKQLGVLCFSEDNLNLLMWSHYALHHKGIVLQFDIAHDVKTMLRASKIHYSNEYPALNWSEMTNDDIRIVFLRKHEGWMYEQEWRMVVPNGANTYLQFDPVALTGLIFGCRADEQFKTDVLNILERRASNNLSPINIYSAVKCEREYRIALQKDESLNWPT